MGNLVSENKVLDSLNYIQKNTNLKSITDEINLTSEKLSKLGYIENQLIENTRENDSSYVAKFNLGDRIKFIHIYIGRKKPTQPSQREGFKKEEETITAKDFNNTVITDLIGLDKTKDTLILPYNEIELFLNSTLQKLEQNGFALAKLKLIHIQKKNHSLYAELEFESGQQRQLNAIVVKFAESNKKNNFPEGHLKQMNRKYQNGTFNKDVVRKIHDDFNKFGFVPGVLLISNPTF